ncbi:hypothetical protein JL193_13515 [Polaribacter batillariae]|uniref:Peptide-N-glycosidase F N-terminal domain-containing protein n=1 Tax=Polaribacter batillariae TaxID=2808900 RepID=A0ABX7SWB6_9FLAO|nr:peptide-N-glycosidase F-related protein [Polaribacter batillariae]QTD37124.1 hypothetical protein JL193_13515 [Polaribacter batillariae]
MKYFPLLLSVFVFTLCSCKTVSNISTESHNFSPFNEVVFYDGYAKTVNKPTQKGVQRINNSTYVTKLNTKDLEKISNRLQLEIRVNAACDNYDRIGNVALFVLPKNLNFDVKKAIYNIEIARFITPFMDKNVAPNLTVYKYDLDNIGKLLSNKNMNKKYDFWLQFHLFGVPYAAQKQIKGCKGRIDTFIGSLQFSSTYDATKNKTQKLQFKPLLTSFHLNNYKGTDVVGKTIKKVEFTLDEKMKNAKLYLITSNHGANRGGEEYIRRNHMISMDHKIVLEYKPGGKSCEPFRKLNTQRNGIYGKEISSTGEKKEWESWNNWCPGDKVPIRVIELGTLEKGKHSFKINVPEAEFKDQEGYVLVSAYIQNK